MARLVFIFLIIIYIYIFDCAGLSSVAMSGGYSLIVLHGLLTAVASLTVEHRL